MDEIYTIEQLDRMRSFSMPPKEIDGFLNDTEFQDISNTFYDVFDNKEKNKHDMYSWESVRRHLDSIKFSNWHSSPAVLKSILKDKIENVIGDSVLDTMLFTKQHNPVWIHYDWWWRESLLPYKTVIIPIGQVNENYSIIDKELWKKTYTIYFKQENYSNILNITKFYDDGKPFCDLSEAEGFKDDFTISKDIHEKYFSHVDYKLLKGLEIESIHEWKPKLGVIHSQTQYHGASNFLKEGLKEKHYIVLFLCKPL